MGECPHCEDLRLRIAQLEASVREDIPIQFGLTRRECELMALLVKFEIVSVDRAMTMMYGHKPAPPEQKVVDVMISHIRRKLRVFGLEILSQWGRGYFLSPPMKQKYHRLVEEMRAPDWQGTIRARTASDPAARSIACGAPDVGASMGGS